MRCSRSVLLVAVVSLIACTQQKRDFSEVDFSAFGAFVEQLDSAQLELEMARILEADSSHWGADRAVRKRYEHDGPVWYTRMGLSADADSLLAVLRRELPRNALDTVAFFLPEIAEDLQVVRTLAFDSVGRDINAVLARLDYHLSKAYVRYTAGQRYGFVRPDKLLNRLDSKPDDGSFTRLFDYAVKAPDYDESVRKLTDDDRMGYLLSTMPEAPLYQTFQQKFEAVTDKDMLHRLAVNMERCRWRLKHPDDKGRMIVVNIPAQQLWAITPDSVLPMRICCGAVNHKTPLLMSQIGYMQVNPDWIVPQSIVRSDFLRHAGDSAYFARNRYYIVERATGDTLSPRGVSVADMESGRLRVGQKGGAGNSLGRIVFRFDNNFGVYLHDTNNHAAFSRDRRIISHGCIRVEQPFELARFLLPDADEWTLDKMRISMDIPPESDQGRDYLKEHEEDPRPLRTLTYHAVRPKVPVYIVYYTAYPNPETGFIETWPDLYGYDKAISKELSDLIL